MKASPFQSRLHRLWQKALGVNEPGLTGWLTALTGALVVVIGLADYLSSTEISLQVFYFVPIALGVMARGWKFGMVIALVCVTTWLGGDIAAGAHYASPVVPVWNAAIALTTYVVLIWLLASLLSLQRKLEQRVRERTTALANEIAERERLEKSILEISERERRSIGHDLHDGLGQHLTGTAITGQLLAEKLLERGSAEAADAAKMVGLVKEAISQTRHMAKGLLLADIDSEGLPTALNDFCLACAAQFRIRCEFQCDGAVSLAASGVSSHLFRIAQEAVRNAIHHGGAKRIDVHLRGTVREIVLTVRDYGSGLPPPEKRGSGLGLRIMAHRAEMIGADFSIERAPGGGTLAQCTLSLAPP